MSKTLTVLREPPEIRFAAELESLAQCDESPRPPGWRLSPRAVRTFLLGGTVTRGGKKKKAEEVVISRKFMGDDTMVERAIVTLMSNRGLILVGEPGTAKSMLSELFAAAISGTSSLTIQGTAGTTEDQIKYSWNYALLLAEGPTQNALVPAPLYHGLKLGQMVRFEEITRCPPEIQDTLISILSDKVLHIPELKSEDNVLLARPGFNLIATANTRDRGVHEMSAALKRRFNFETVAPLSDKKLELQIVLKETENLLHGAEVTAQMPEDVLEILITTFMDLRKGRTEEGTIVEKPQAVMSTAEAVSVAFSACLDACHFGDGVLRGEHLARHLVGTVLKDSGDDAKKVRNYFEVIVKNRAQRSPTWKSFYDQRGVFQ